MIGKMQAIFEPLSMTSLSHRLYWQPTKKRERLHAQKNNWNRVDEQPMREKNDDFGFYDKSAGNSTETIV